MQKKEVSAIINKLSKSGIKLNHHESFDCVQDYFNRRELDSDSEENDESDSDLDLISSARITGEMGGISPPHYLSSSLAL